MIIGATRPRIKFIRREVEFAAMRSDMDGEATELKISTERNNAFMAMARRVAQLVQVAPNARIWILGGNPTMLEVASVPTGEPTHFIEKRTSKEISMISPTATEVHDLMNLLYDAVMWEQGLPMNTVQFMEF